MATLGEAGVIGSNYIGLNPATLKTSAIQSNDSFGNSFTNNKMDWDLVIVLVVAFYFYPSMVAGATGKSNVQAIFITNFLLGWTGVVWLICLTVALMETKKED